MVDMVALLDGLSTVRLMDDTHKCGVRMFILYFCLGVYGYEERKKSEYTVLSTDGTGLHRINCRKLKA